MARLTNKKPAVEDARKLTGPEKAAVILLSLGEDHTRLWQGLDEGWSQAEILERGIFATRQLAKRQITWLRSTAQRTVVITDGTQDPIARVMELAEQYLKP